MVNTRTTILPPGRFIAVVIYLDASRRVISSHYYSPPLRGIVVYDSCACTRAVRYSAFSFARPAAMQVYWNKRKLFHKQITGQALHCGKKEKKSKKVSLGIPLYALRSPIFFLFDPVCCLFPHCGAWSQAKLPQDLFETPTWPPFHCFGTPIWPP